LAINSPTVVEKKQEGNRGDGSLEGQPHRTPEGGCSRVGVMIEGCPNDGLQSERDEADGESVSRMASWHRKESYFSVIARLRQTEGTHIRTD
jgi:hypothetical protein